MRRDPRDDGLTGPPRRLTISLWQRTPWLSEVFAVGRDYYERTKDEAKRGLASAKSGEFHS